MTVSPDRPAAATILVGVDLGLPHFDAELEELGQLAQTAGMEPVARVACKRKAPDAALFVGRGKADEIKQLAELFEFGVEMGKPEVHPHEEGGGLFGGRIQTGNDRNGCCWMPAPPVIRGRFRGFRSGCSRPRPARS